MFIMDIESYPTIPLQHKLIESETKSATTIIDQCDKNAETQIKIPGYHIHHSSLATLCNNNYINDDEIVQFLWTVINANNAKCFDSKKI